MTCGQLFLSAFPLLIREARQRHHRAKLRIEADQKTLLRRRNAQIRDLALSPAAAALRDSSTDSAKPLRMVESEGRHLALPEPRDARTFAEIRCDGPIQPASFKNSAEKPMSSARSHAPKPQLLFLTLEKSRDFQSPSSPDQRWKRENRLPQCPA